MRRLFHLHSALGILLISCSVLVDCGPRGTAEELYKRGTEELSSGDRKMAYKCFKAALKKKPEEFKYLWAASGVAPNNNIALVHAKAAWDQGFKTPPVMLRLAALSFHTEQKQKLEYALSLYRELPDSIKSDELKGDLFFNFAQYDSTLKYWGAVLMENEDPAIVSKIALVYEKKQDLDGMSVHLEKYRFKKLLNSRGYNQLMSLRALQYRYATADTLYREAVEQNESDDFLKLEYSLLLLAQGRMDESEKVLQNVYTNDAHLNVNQFRARTLHGYELFLKRDSTKLWSLLETADTTRFKAAEKRFYLFLFDRMRERKKSPEELRKIRRDLPPSPWVDLALAREYGHLKQFAKADTVYRLVPPKIRFSPNVMEEYALIQMRLGRDDDALALISRLHSNRIVTRTSLEMFRDLTFRKKLIDKSRAAQKLLESKYKDDVKVRWSGAVMSLKTGQIDSALSQFTRLAREYPKEERFEVMRLTVLYLNGEYDRVIQESSQGSLPEQMAKTLQARAYRKKGENGQAGKAYRRAVEIDKDNVELSVEYTEFLTQTKDFTTAANLYSRLIDNFNADDASDSSMLVGLLNNYAWTAVHSANNNRKLVIQAIEQAYGLMPENRDVLDTYAVVLLEYEEYKDCIKLLSRSKVAAQDPNLKVHLAKAYEKRNDINRAVRTYQEAISMSDTSKVKLSIDPSELRSHTQSLLPKE
ncbi:MAG: tetratricopeptide repeat protein [Chitinispirillaceae bacterium]